MLQIPSLYYGKKYVRNVNIMDDSQVFTSNKYFKTNKIILEDKVLIQDFWLWKDHERCMKYIEKNPSILKFIKNQTDDMCGIAVEKNPCTIRWVINQTEKLCKIALKKRNNYNNLFLMYIIDQTFDICKYAISQRAWEFSSIKLDNFDKFNKEQQKELIWGAIVKEISVLQVISEMPDEFYEEVIAKFPLGIRYVTQTERLCMIAVKKNGDLLRYIKEHTFNVCLEAVTFHGNSLKHIILKNFHKDDAQYICNKAVANYGMSIWHVPSKYINADMCADATKQFRFAMIAICKHDETTEISMAVVKVNGFALRWITYQTPSICKAAVEECGIAVKYAKYQTPDVCLAAVRQDGHALEWIKIQTLKLCREAIKQNKYALNYVDDHFVNLLADKLDNMIHR